MSLACLCLAPPSPDVTFCEEHHRYARNGNELTSVSKVIRSVWPMKPYERVDEAVLENARERGVELDNLFCAWLNSGGEVFEIPKGTREDARDLLNKTIELWLGDSLIKGIFNTQVVLADDEIAGMADLIGYTGEGYGIYDLKCVSELQPSYRIQLGAYCALWASMHEGQYPKDTGILHVTKSKPAKLVRYEVSIVVSEFNIVRDMWRLTCRLAAKRRTA